MFLGNKKCRILAACGVSQTPIGFSNREENKKLSNASMELMFFIFSEFAKLGKGLILESNFHRAELEKLHKIAQDNAYDVLTIAL